MGEIVDFKLSYSINGAERETVCEQGYGKNHDGISIEYESRPVKGGRMIKCSIKTEQPVVIDRFSAETDIILNDRKVSINGYQTWTDSREAGKDYYYKGLNPLAKLILTPYGDYSFYKYRKKKGFIHSHTYICLKDGRESLIIGSLDESKGFTIFEADYTNNSLSIVKETDGITINGDYEILCLFLASGTEKSIWDDYSRLFRELREGKLYSQEVGKCIGWTSWYNYYTRITEDIILMNLKNIHDSNIPLEVFQIDDGYQQAVGDWLSINSKFPKGMKFIADEIKKAGFRPGLWLAPFICEKTSDIFRKHYQWILKDKNNRPVRAGWNPNWSGIFYCFDIYNKEFREYLKLVFDTMLNIWGYEMVKLDFLYAAALLPRNNRTRGGMMDDAMELLRELCGDKWILGCGVPLGPSFGRVEYCRIGADVSPYWEDWKLKAIGYQERVSTNLAINNTAGRYNLNGRFFMNDPDVFMLREMDNKLNKCQRYTLFFINNLLGSLVFFSDNINDYSIDEMYKLKSIFPAISPDVENIKSEKELLSAEFRIDDRQYVSYSNLSEHRLNIDLAKGLYYHKDGSMVSGGMSIGLMPYETICLLKLPSQKSSAGVEFIGSDGYVFPAAEIEAIEINGTIVTVKYKKGYINKRKVYFIVSDNIAGLTVNSKMCIPEELNGHRMAVYSE